MMDHHVHGSLVYKIEVAWRLGPGQTEQNVVGLMLV